MGWFPLAQAVFSAVTTWNPADKQADVVLTNGNLTASAPSGTAGFDNGVRGTTSHTTGTWAFEVTIDTFATALGMGIATSGANLASYIGNDAFAWGLLWNGSSWGTVNNGSFVHNGLSPTPVNGDKIGMVYNGGTNQISFYINGTLLQTETIAAATWFPIAVVRTGTDQLTGNFGQSAFTGTYTGATAWG